MKYDDDQCVRCGAIRAARSLLCVDCLVAAANSFAAALDIAEAKIKELEGKNKKLTALCERLLDHITSEALYAGEYERWMTIGYKIAKREMQDGKNRPAESKGR